MSCMINFETDLFVIGCIEFDSPDVILCGWLGSKHQLTIEFASDVTSAVDLALDLDS